MIANLSESIPIKTATEPLQQKGSADLKRTNLPKRSSQVDTRRLDLFVPSAQPHHSALSTPAGRFKRVAELCKQVPGANVADFAAYIKAFKADPPPRLQAILGDGWSEGKLAKMYAVDHTQAVLESKNVVVVSPAVRKQGIAAKLTTFAVYTHRKSGKPLAYLIESITRQTTGGVSSYLDYLFVDIRDPEAKGLGTTILSRCAEVGALAEVQRKTLLAAYVGRYRWALEGYDFETSEELTVATSKLRRFLEHLDVSAEDLVFARDDGSVEAFTWDNLKHSWDFAHLKSLAGPIEVPLRVGAEDRRVEFVDVGRGFLMGDFKDVELADKVLQEWHGSSPIHPDSPNQRQKQRYYRRRFGAM